MLFLFSFVYCFGTVLPIVSVGYSPGCRVYRLFAYRFCRFFVPCPGCRVPFRGCFHLPGGLIGFSKVKQGQTGFWRYIVLVLFNSLYFLSFRYVLGAFLVPFIFGTNSQLTPGAVTLVFTCVSSGLSSLIRYRTIDPFCLWSENVKITATTPDFSTFFRFEGQLYTKGRQGLFCYKLLRFPLQFC